MWDVNGDGYLEMLFTGEGYRDPSLQIDLFSAIHAIQWTGNPLFSTQANNSNFVWYTGPANGSAVLADTAFLAAPIMVRSSIPSGPRLIAVGAESGRVFAWQTDPLLFGQRVTGFPVETDIIADMGRVPIRTALVSAM